MNFRFGEDLRPACLWDREDIPDIEMEVTGRGVKWAHTTYSPSTYDDTQSLMSSRSTRISQKTCNDFYKDDSLSISDNQVCYGNSLYIVPDSCQLDYGGPIERKYWPISRYFPYQVGINIYGNDCGFGYPAVATRVSKYIDWIDTVIFGQPWRQGSHVVESSNSCQLPSGGIGTCKQSSQCLEVVEKVKQGQINLRDYICDFDNHRDPSVCCPINYDFAGGWFNLFLPFKSPNV